MLASAIAGNIDQRLRIAATPILLPSIRKAIPQSAQCHQRQKRGSNRSQSKSQGPRNASETNPIVYHLFQDKPRFVPSTSNSVFVWRRSAKSFSISATFHTERSVCKENLQKSSVSTVASPSPSRLDRTDTTFMQNIHGLLALAPFTLQMLFCATSSAITVPSLNLKIMTLFSK